MKRKFTEKGRFDNTWICSVCETEKDISAFYINKRDGTARSPCKECKRIYNKNHCVKNKEHIQKYNFNFKLKYLYNMTREDYENKLVEQNNVCAICKLPSRIKNKQLFIDHCHRTDKVRGLLCLKCNSVLGMANDDAALLQSAISYLERHKN